MCVFCYTGLPSRFEYLKMNEPSIIVINLHIPPPIYYKPLYFVTLAVQSKL